jgi:hypothetical protein
MHKHHQVGAVLLLHLHQIWSSPSITLTAPPRVLTILTGSRLTLAFAADSMVRLGRC